MDVEDLLYELIHKIDTIDDKVAVSLLDRELPDLPMWHIRKIDSEGKEDAEKWQTSQAYIRKVIVARGFEQKGLLRVANFSYDRATKYALQLKLPMAAIRCSWRSLKLYKKRIEQAETQFERERLEEDLEEWAIKRTFKAYEMYGLKVNHENSETAVKSKSV